jgi:hypothetical protein
MILSIPDMRLSIPFRKEVIGYRASHLPTLCAPCKNILDMSISISKHTAGLTCYCLRVFRMQNLEVLFSHENRNPA